VDERPHILPGDFVKYVERIHGMSAEQFLVGRRVLLTYVRGRDSLIQDLGLGEAPVRLHPHPVYTRPGTPPAEISVMRGPIGAPLAVAVVEELVALGAQEVWILGYAGSLTPDLRYGSLFIPDAAHVDEGTSGHYGRTGIAHPDPGLLDALTSQAPDVATGPIWTTDAIYREMPSQIRRYQALGVKGVDMETSALFNLGAHLNIPVAALMVVSDELFHAWQPGFGSDEVSEGCQRAHGIMKALLTRPWPSARQAPPLKAGTGTTDTAGGVGIPGL
jgi:uridine phosphorylase